VKTPLDNINNITEIIKSIHVVFALKYECNAVTFSTVLHDLIKIIGAKGKLVTITEMPHQRYFIDSEGVYKIRAGFTQGPGNKPPDVQEGCRKNFERRNGSLKLAMYKQYRKSLLNSTKETIEDLGVTETTCMVDYDKGLEAYYVSFSFLFLKDGYVHVTIITMFRRRGVNTPALHVTRWLDDSEGEDGAIVMPTTRDTTTIYCNADAAKTPYIAAARVGKDGNHQLLPKKSGYSYDFLYGSLGTAHFSFKSPSLGETDEYICSAASGREVVSQRFQVVRHVTVSIKEHESALPMDKVCIHKLNATNVK
jgi:hypothetical protein